MVIKDLNGNTLSTILGGETVNYTYDNKNRLTAISGRANGASEEFTFDALDNLSSYVYNNGSNTVSESYTYNANRQLASKTVDGKTYTYAYKDDTAKSLESVSVDVFTFAPNTDALGRNRGKTITVSNNKIAEEQITYLKFGDHATNIPATVYYGDKKNGKYAFSDHFKYKYDSMGNITEIRENGELYAKYTYDTIGRLVREDNKKRGKTVTFTYDANGNILCRKEYAFTLTDNLDELVSTTFAYTYDGDKLLSYNGKVCEYDIVGNPTTYRDKTATWANGRQLTSFDGNTFTYDNLGRRISKKIPKDDGTTETITFTYDASGNLIRQSNGISFIYDASGVCGLTYSDATYFYRKDILGNIVALLDANGEIVAKYTYDAWGKCQTTVVNSNAVEIANLNPFRYRGYYYDVETELYFLKTRYYDPEIGRFITIDDISYLDPEAINGLNLYAYCRNNPVMGYDPNGTFDLWEFFRGAGNIVTGVLAIGAGAIVLIGGAPIGMLIIAGITVGAGVLTLNNGIADTVSSFTGYNYMSDGLFNGNTTAYNWYSGIISTVAGIGTAICGNFIKTEYFMRGATPGTEGKMTLQPGMELDRYGLKYGRFLTNPGTAPGQLNLPASNNLVLNHYKVLKPFKVATGIVDGGGGFQYFTWRSVHRLIQMGYLAII